MSKKTILENIARNVMQSGLLKRLCVCRETAREIVKEIRKNNQLAGCHRSVLTVFYLAGETVWDHTVVCVNLPWLHVVEARLNYLALESNENNNVPDDSGIFVGTLTDWQKRVERLTGGIIVDYLWTTTVPEDGSVNNRLLDAEFENREGNPRRISLGFHKPSSVQKIRN